MRNLLRGRIAAYALAVALVVTFAISSYAIYNSFSSVEYSTDYTALEEGFWHSKNVVDIGEKRDKIPVQIPGPLDRHWAGDGVKGVQINPPVSGDLTITLRLIESHDKKPPLLLFFIGDKETARFQSPPGAGKNPGLWNIHGHRSKFTFTAKNVPPNFELIILNIKGSWAAIKSITIAPILPSWAKWATSISWFFLFASYLAYAIPEKRWFVHITWGQKRGRAIYETLIETIKQRPGRVAILLFITLTVIFAVNREIIVPYNSDEERRTHLLSGDDHSYMIAALSLARDGDLNIYNNVKEEHWRQFMPDFSNILRLGKLAAYQAVAPRMKDVDPAEWKEKQLALHRPGTSALIAPSSLSKDNFRWWSYVTISFISVMMVSVTAFLWLSGSSVTRNPITLVLIVAFALSPPSFFYFNTVLPDLMASLILFLIVALLYRPTKGRLIASALLVIAAPWFTDRVVAPAAILGIGSLFMTQKKEIRISLVAIFGVGAVALGAYYYQRFGAPYPIHHDPRENAIAIANIPIVSIKILLDSGRGILFLAPVLVFAPAAFYRWWKSGEKRFLFFLTLSGLVLSVLTVTAHIYWRAGQCPAGRYSIVFLWMALPAFIMWAKTGMTLREKIAITILLVLGFMQTIFLFDNPGAWRTDFHIMLNFPETHFFHAYMPWLYKPDYGEWLKAFYWGAGFFVYFLIGTIRTKKEMIQ